MFVDVEISSDKYTFSVDPWLLDGSYRLDSDAVGVERWDPLDLYEAPDEKDWSVLGYRFSPLRLNMVKVLGVQNARRLWASKKRLRGLVANETSRMRLELTALQYSQLCTLCAVQAEERFQPFIDELSIIAERNEAA